MTVSPTDGTGPTQGQRKTDQGGNWTHDLRVRSPPLYRLSHKVRREQAVGTEDVKVTAINMYKYKERLRSYKRWPCSTYILNRINWRECSVRWSTIFLAHMTHVSVSPTDGTGPTQGQRKTLTRVGIEPTTFGLKYKCYTANVCMNVTFPCLYRNYCVKRKQEPLEILRAPKVHCPRRTWLETATPWMKYLF